jgi:hypothetical protein
VKSSWALLFVVFLFCSFCIAQTETWSISFLTYLGGSALNGDDGYAKDTVFDVQTDAAGNIYAFGLTTSHNFPITENAWAKTHMFEQATYMAKFDSAGRKLLLLTYIPGTLYHQAVAQDGTVYLLVSGTDDPSLNNASTPQLYYWNHKLREPERVEVGLGFYPWRIAIDQGGNLTLVGLTGNTQNGYAMAAQITPAGQRGMQTIVYQKTLFYCQQDCMIRNFKMGPRGELAIAWRWNPNTNADVPISSDAMQSSPMFTIRTGRVVVPIQNLLTVYAPLAKTLTYGTFFSAEVDTASPKIVFQDSKHWHIVGAWSSQMRVLSFEKQSDCVAWVHNAFYESYKNFAPLWMNGKMYAFASQAKLTGDQLVLGRVEENGLADTQIVPMNGAINASAVFPLADGRVIFAGSTTAQDWGIGYRAYQRTNAGGEDVFIGIAAAAEWQGTTAVAERASRLTRPGALNDPAVDAANDLDADVAPGGMRLSRNMSRPSPQAK